MFSALAAVPFVVDARLFVDMTMFVFGGLRWVWEPWKCGGMALGKHEKHVYKVLATPSFSNLFATT
jgi:hypothetical protein